MASTLTNLAIREKSVERCRLWHENDTWDLIRWENALGGEVGELLNIIKKLNRKESDVVGNTEKDGQVLVNMLCVEAADVWLYLELLLDCVGVGITDFQEPSAYSMINLNLNRLGTELFKRTAYLMVTCDLDPKGDPGMKHTQRQAIIGHAEAIRHILASMCLLLQEDIQSQIVSKFNLVSQRNRFEVFLP